MSEPGEQMIAALREVGVPVLRNMGFSGSFPHFRRIRESQIDLLTFQFNRHEARSSLKLQPVPSKASRIAPYFGN